MELVDNGQSQERAEGRDCAELLVEPGSDDPDANDRWRERFRNLSLSQLCQIVCGEAAI